MTKANENQALRKAAEIVYENSAFIFVEDISLPEASVLESWEGTALRIEYSGDAQGFLELQVQNGFAHILAQNMLGLEDGDEKIASSAADALQESLNMLCGYFLTEYYGENAVFSIGMPKICSELSLEASLKNAGIWLDAEGFMLYMCHGLSDV
ncbi:MAG: chemotaxis protein CheX [Fibrobacter sp.]|nr:chemotaxis protein CheX [Fibrobacter sp.]